LETKSVRWKQLTRTQRVVGAGAAIAGLMLVFLILWALVTGDRDPFVDLGDDHAGMTQPSVQWVPPTSVK
jgi:hypothetical protein